MDVSRDSLVECGLYGKCLRLEGLLLPVENDTLGHEFGWVNAVAPVVLKNDEITFEELQVLLYEERAFDNIVISPGPGSPVRADDIGIIYILTIHYCGYWRASLSTSCRRVLVWTYGNLVSNCCTLRI